MDKYHKELIENFKTFNQVVGGAMELSDRGWKEEVWCSDKYKETMEELYIKYFPDEAQNFIPIKTDDYLKIEDEIADYLEKEILEIMG